MTEMPPGRPSEPRTGPSAPAPAHGDGPTGPSTPTGRTEPDEGCVHESCWYPACAAPTECGGTLDCCAMQACDNPRCPGKFPFQQEPDHA